MAWIAVVPPSQATRRGDGGYLLGAGCGRRSGLVGPDAVGHIRGVLLDEPQQGRPAGVLPGQANEVQAGDLGDAAAVGDMAFTDHTGMWIQV